MGRQIALRAIGEDEEHLLAFVSSVGGRVLADISAQDAPRLLDDRLRMMEGRFWLARHADLSSVSMLPLVDRGWHVDQARSPVIEFDRTGVVNEHALAIGRLYFETGYWEERTWRPRSREFSAWADRIFAWVRKRFRRSEDGSAYEGPAASAWREAVAAGEVRVVPPGLDRGVGHRRPVGDPLADHLLLCDISRSGPGIPREGIWTRPIEAHRFVIATIPLFVRGIALGDVVTARPVWGERVDEISAVEPAGHRAVRVSLTDARDQMTRNRVERLVAQSGLTAEEWWRGRRIPVDAPDRDTAAAICSDLEELRSGGQVDVDVTPDLSGTP